MDAAARWRERRLTYEELGPEARDIVDTRAKAMALAHGLTTVEARRWLMARVRRYTAGGTTGTGH